MSIEAPKFNVVLELENVLTISEMGSFWGPLQVQILYVSAKYFWVPKFLACVTSLPKRLLNTHTLCSPPIIPAQDRGGAISKAAFTLPDDLWP